MLEIKCTRVSVAISLYDFPVSSSSHHSDRHHLPYVITMSSLCHCGYILCLSSPHRRLQRHHDHLPAGICTHHGVGVISPSTHYQGRPGHPHLPRGQCCHTCYRGRTSVVSHQFHGVSPTLCAPFHVHHPWSVTTTVRSK